MHQIGIVEQSCYFAKLCDDEFNKKDIGINLFLLQLRVHEQMLNTLCEKWHKIYFKMLGVTS